MSLRKRLALLVKNLGLLRFLDVPAAVELWSKVALGAHLLEYSYGSNASLSTRFLFAFAKGVIRERPYRRIAFDSTAGTSSPSR